METKTSEEWYNEGYATFNNKSLIILDPDGWDRQNYQYSWYEEKITLKEFEKRLSFSTIISKEKND